LGNKDERNYNIKGCDILPHPEFENKLYYNTKSKERQEWGDDEDLEI
jgi:hypothetical protein